jgi:hypothetical protein
MVWMAMHIYSGNYQSLEHCCSSALLNIKNLQLDNADYEYGLNCERLIKGNDLDSTRVCDKTER